MNTRNVIFRTGLPILAGIVLLAQACNGSSSAGAKGTGSDSFFISAADTAMPPESTGLKSPATDMAASQPDYAAKDSPGVKPQVQSGKIKLTDTTKK